MEQLELIKILMKNTNINFLLGAGTSYNPVVGKVNYPLMWDLLDYIKSNTNVIDFYSGIKKDSIIPVGMG
ncbi:hypothetical protein, partial [Robinsoniella peoriensis]